MNLRPHRKNPPELNIAPLIDVVFLLLIFFMVTTTFQRETAIEIELPEAGGEPAEAPSKRLDITIDRDGRYYVNELELVRHDLPSLKRAIAKVIGDDRALPVVINADAETPHQAVIRALDAASQLGLVRMTFAAQQPSE